nr:unnamed protein product [Digitaria exilis]
MGVGGCWCAAGGWGGCWPAPTTAGGSSGCRCTCTSWTGRSGGGDSCGSRGCRGTCTSWTGMSGGGGRDGGGGGRCAWPAPAMVAAAAAMAATPAGAAAGAAPAVTAADPELEVDGSGDEEEGGREKRGGGGGWLPAMEMAAPAPAARRIMALLSGFAGVYTEVCLIAIIKKRPSRNINVQNFWLYIFGVVFNLVAICVQDYDAVMNKGFFHGYSFITVLMILNHALSGIAVSMVMKYADNIVKLMIYLTAVFADNMYLQVYSTSVAMLLTAVVSVFLFSFHLSLAFFLGSTVVSVSVYLHSVGKLQTQK